jgi:prepilin-type N-terminal cleavage/methylation domain-containing protein
MRKQRQAFTLIELLVSIALGTLLIGIVTFVWMQSNRIFSSTVNNLEAYQRLRAVLDLIERDLANTNRAVNMEFYVDNNPANGRRDDAEQLLSHSPPGSGPLAAGSPANSIRVPVDPIDPLVVANKPEFCEDDNPQNVGFSSLPYFYAPTIFSPPPYEIPEGDGYLEDRSYWRDEVYVRTFATTPGGGSVPAMVHYRLVPQADGRSSLRRRVWWTDPTGAVVRPAPGVNATDRTAMMASGICDLKFGFFFRPSTAAGGSSTEGIWYHVGCPVSNDAGKLRNSDEERGIRTATAVGGISEQHENLAQFGGANAVSFFYEGHARMEYTDGGTPLLRTITSVDDPAPSAANMGLYTNFDFPGVRPGDKIYLYDARDDDDLSIDPDASGPAQAKPANTPAQNIFRFPDREYTVDAIVSQSDATDPNKYYIGVKLREPVNFSQLGRYWLNGAGTGEATFDVTTGNMGSKGGPPRTIRAAFNLSYRVAFLPPAFLVRISIDDRYNRRVHQMERVVRLLQH